MFRHTTTHQNKEINSLTIMEEEIRQVTRLEKGLGHCCAVQSQKAHTRGDEFTQFDQCRDREW
jgi:hypothetical protein